MLRRADADRSVLAATDSVLGQVRLARHEDRTVTELSHGDQRKLDIAMLMALEPRVFMFDEPTAGMSADEAPGVLRLIERVRRNHRCCVLLVEHKLDVIRALADRIIVLQDGRCVADGTPASVMESAAVQAAYMGRELADG